MNITRPTLLVDEKKCRSHIHTMSQRANSSDAIFRPHFKTHQSRAIAAWYKSEGVTKITTSSLAMAAYFAADGWDDITVAFPLNHLEYELINSLAATIRLNLLAVSRYALEALAQKLTHPVQIFIEIDTGYGRTGVLSYDTSTIDRLISFIELDKNLVFAGFLSHAGHSYKCRSKNEIKSVHVSSLEQVITLKKRYVQDYPGLIVSIGDTPTCSIIDTFNEVDEIRPGNFIFYDVTQTEIGSCEIDDISICIACPVVAIYPDKNEIVIHGGAVHLSKDTLINKEGKQLFGRIARITENGWTPLPEEYYVRSLSQEHGIVSVPSNMVTLFKPGDIIGVLPVHSCLAADCMAGYQTLTGDRLDHFKGVVK